MLFLKKPSFFSVNFDSLRVGTRTLFRTNSVEETRNGFCYSAEKSAVRGIPRSTKVTRKNQFYKTAKILTKWFFRTSKVVFSDNILEVSEFSSARACPCAVRTCLLGLTFTKNAQMEIQGTLHPRSNVRGHIVVLAFSRGQRVDAAEDPLSAGGNRKKTLKNFSACQ